MTVGERIKAALDPFGLPVRPDLYTGNATEFLTYNYALLPVQFADGRPLLWRALVQVHLFCPRGVNRVRLVAQITTALVRGGFTWPEVQNVTMGGGNDRSSIDDKSQHWVFECEQFTKMEGST